MFVGSFTQKLKHSAPTTFRKYLKRLALDWMFVLAVIIVLLWGGAFAFELFSADATTPMAIGVVSLAILSYALVTQSIRKEMTEQKTEMFKTIFIEGYLNSAAVYCRNEISVESAEHTLTILREVVQKNNIGGSYNRTTVWDFDELLSICVNELKREFKSEGETADDTAI